MVRFRSRRFGRSEEGSVLTEGLLILPIMFLAFAIIVELGLMLFQWNMAAKSMHLAVRKLVVSDPVTSDFNTVFAFDPAQGGQLIDADATIISQCDGDPSSAIPDCNAGVMDRLVNGAGGPAWPGLTAYFPSIEPEHVQITYEQSGLGYQGRPLGPVVTVRLQINRAAVDLPVLGGLFDFVGIGFPPFTVSATSEDLTG
ncbi:MAG: TadE/TadG family type IV pilus assembly protein [Rhizobiaceae bacterium]